MKKILLTLILAFGVFMAKAAKAYPLPVTVTQSDGTQLTVIGYGDEHSHWFTTSDGVLLCRVGTDFYIASTTAEGELVATSQLAHEANNRSSEEIALAKKQNRKLFFNHDAKMRREMMKREPIVVDNTFLQHMGNPKVPVILVDFNDVNFSLPDPKKSFEQYLNGEGYPKDFGNSENRNYGSVAQYFDDMSFGKFRPQFDIYGPVRLDNELVYYGEGRKDRMDRFIPEVIEKIKNSVDFSQYDSNNDGNVDLVYIIYAGYSGSISQNSEDCLWPKVGTTKGFEVKINDNLKVYRYGISNELNGYPGAYKTEPLNRINGVGLFCHEFSHALGLPDFYPTDTQSVDNQAMEYWSLMDAGEYVDNGHCPAAYTAWERESLGWIEIEDLTDDVTDLQILPVEKDGGKAYRIKNDNDETNREYFIIENIQTKGWNTRQKGHGLLMYHVNYISDIFKLQGSNGNSVNNSIGSPNMAVVPADGFLAASTNVGTIKDWGTGEGGKVTNQDYYKQLAGDPFPGTSHIMTANERMSLPNLRVYNGESLNKALTKIEESNGIITISFTKDFDHYITTNIHSIEKNNTESKDIYTLDGRYVGNNKNILSKGIYIINNQKVVVK